MWFSAWFNCPSLQASHCEELEKEAERRQEAVKEAVEEERKRTEVSQCCGSSRGGSELCLVPGTVKGGTGRREEAVVGCPG